MKKLLAKIIKNKKEKIILLKKKAQNKSDLKSVINSFLVNIPTT